VYSLEEGKGGGELIVEKRTSQIERRKGCTITFNGREGKGG